MFLDCLNLPYFLQPFQNWITSYNVLLLLNVSNQRKWVLDKILDLIGIREFAFLDWLEELFQYIAIARKYHNLRIKDLIKAWTRTSEAYSEPCQTSKFETYLKTFYKKAPTSDVWKSKECAFELM